MDLSIKMLMCWVNLLSETLPRLEGKGILGGGESPRHRDCEGGKPWKDGILRTECTHSLIHFYPSGGGEGEEGAPVCDPGRGRKQ